ncbi:transcriptional regulator [Thiospirochaeta perfilievii]|uniref:Transcriptional regulator n=1 Tax=Thiospirochaeta perfilievii TaxID=252967 RepID=A0A5C1QEC2_9SPIO|nr:Trp family transcriptional regulator [Thiospirochaeta perfilievii]QEN05737.1 transcriptional regulator [Thiospirochaeta perfilievii]
MTDEMSIRALDELSLSLAKIEDKELIKEFLECILTENEISGVTSRWTLVRRLNEGQTQRGIANELGLSLCKITRGSKELKKERSAFKKVIDIYDDILSKE